MIEQSEKIRLNMAELDAQEIVALPDLEAETAMELPARELLTYCGCGCGLLDVNACVSVNACLSISL